MALDAEDITRIAHLARLGLSPEEVHSYAACLNNILHLVDKMQAVDTQGIHPMAHPLDAVQPLRADIVTEGDHRELYQAIAPATENGLYLVPKVIE